MTGASSGGFELHCFEIALRVCIDAGVCCIEDSCIGDIRGIRDVHC